jgi:sec-independent protein translocase protein TatA
LGQRPLSPLGCVLIDRVTPFSRERYMSLLAFMGIGTTELIIIMVVILVLFGHRLPSVMRSMGRGIKEFKEGINDEVPADDSDKGDAKREKNVYEP